MYENKRERVKAGDAAGNTRLRQGGMPRAAVVGLAVAGLLVALPATMPGQSGGVSVSPEHAAAPTPRAVSRAALTAATVDAAFVGPLYADPAVVDAHAAPGYLRATSSRTAASIPSIREPRDAKTAAPLATSIPAAARAKMSGPVAALAARGGDEPAEIVVSYAEYPELFEDSRVAALGGEVVRRFGTLDMMAVRLPAESLVELAIGDTVDRLSLDDDVRSLGSERVSANLPAAASPNAVYRGSSVGVAIIDTGIAQHADLPDHALQYSFLDGAFPRPVIKNGAVTSYGDDPRDDSYGHGTHVAGIVAGDGSNSSGEHGGAADRAHLLALQVLDGSGRGSTSDVIAALDWLAQYGSYFGIKVVNLSLGQGVTESIDTDPMVAAAEALWDQGIVVVVAAGNFGRAGNATVMSPANSRKIITVGSLTDNGTGSDFSDDYVSTFSSRGPTEGDLVLKPDLIAPGNRLVAAIPKQARLRDDLPSRVVGCSAASCGDDYFELSGTSMAAPMVAAAAALMLEKDPSLTPATIKARLMRSARKIDAPPIDAGAGVLDVEAALDDTGVIGGEALSPLMVADDANGGVFIEDTALLWGSDAWGAGYLWSGGFTWASGYGRTDDDDDDDESDDDNDETSAGSYLWTNGGVGASGYGWTDAVMASGYGWTDAVMASGYGWTDGRSAQAFGIYDAEAPVPVLLDDEPVRP